MNEFTRLERYANLQKAPAIKFKDLEAVFAAHQKQLEARQKELAALHLSAIEMEKSGHPAKQAIAASLNQARKSGAKIPRKK
jgi:hypothetical protein